MTPNQASRQVLDPSLLQLPSRMDTNLARIMLLAIALQESRLEARVQVLKGGGRGPAHGLWQFEAGGGVKGVLRHSATQHWAKAICYERQIPPNQSSVWEAIEHDDVLACCFARLLLWTDPRILPSPDQADRAYQLYLKLWRPGKPHPATWPENHRLARIEVMGE